MLAISLKNRYLQAYNPMIYSVPGQHAWTKTNTPDIVPPVFSINRGRKQENRRKGKYEVPKPKDTSRMGTITCSNYKLHGHKYTSCTKELRPDLQMRKNKHVPQPQPTAPPAARQAPRAAVTPPPAHVVPPTTRFASPAAATPPPSRATPPAARQVPPARIAYVAPRSNYPAPRQAPPGCSAYSAPRSNYPAGEPSYKKLGPGVISIVVTGEKKDPDKQMVPLIPENAYEM